jgi:ABC-type branched-subunit amino acid transport system substrate-binding protein
MNRRHFLLATAGALAGLAFDKLWAAERRGAFLAQILPASGTDRDVAARGALLAAEEAARAAELLGVRLELRVGGSGDASKLIDQGALALIGGLDASERAALSQIAEVRGVPLLTTRAPGDPGDDEPLRTHIFHVASGPRERRATLERWRAGEGGAAAGEAEIAGWHPSLKRFGAEQLNQRYRERFGTSMEPLAWTSWMAVKAAAEAALRGAGLLEQAPADLSRRLATLGFDGHKGMRLRFRPSDHALQQPLYVVSRGRVLAEIPPEDEQE